ncbi:hypothetical protein BRADI_4g25636v3 [Brachypodium distachyon]|uniref:Reverse transcriptase zinc-binding domain-containing protein n=1 Tax=Brachypodium distachyon TaxID=15368 RepID=A0A0Q3EPM2_BRADI|nr:hypothetical protein BRADI_4g25636v3 [Brachypodium distachyon]
MESSTNNTAWKTLWKLRIPAKVKIFVWRTLHGALPCRVVLANRHIKVSGQCPLCAIGAEDILHMLFKCPRAAEIWSLLECQKFISEALEYDRAGSAVLEFLLCSSFRSGIPPDGFPELVATTCWYLWWERHKIGHDEPVQLPAQSAFAIRSLAANFTAASPSKAHLKKQGWTKPPTDRVKLNVDAGFDADSLRATMGAIIRDHHGNFVSATNWKIDFVADVEAAEAHVVRIGLELVALTGCTRVIIESDSFRM